MPLLRMICANKTNAAEEAKDAIVNTLYFNVSGSVDDPDYQTLTNDLAAIWRTQAGLGNRWVEVRCYDMRDAEPRPIRARASGVGSGSSGRDGVPQAAICLSYYADRNLPRQRGRIYCLAASTASLRPTTGQRATVLGLAQKFADLGGVNVDWSLWSPTTQQHTRINHAWVDDSWDIIRSRKIARTVRETWTGNG